MKELVILSGKGGTGKTSLAGAFTQLAQNAVFCDCDVDAANLGLILKPDIQESHEFKVSKLAHIKSDLCTKCGLCQELCRFSAIEDFRIDPVSCEGCGLCAYACPNQAISMDYVLSGHWFLSHTCSGPLVHARLEPGEENSGRLVSLVRQKAKEIAQSLGKKTIITDGPPGIGCPVIASLSGATAALLVTEPSLSGIHDLERIMQVCDHFQTPVMVAINKWDIDRNNALSIKEICDKKDYPMVGLIPYDLSVPKTMVQGLPVTSSSSPAARAMEDTWRKVLERLLDID